MSHPYIGPLSAYNSLTDKHLTGYFNNTRIRRHLQRAGLITRSGRILTEKEYRINAMRRDHQKYIRECLAQAIFHKVLDMERRHQIDIKRKLESFAQKEKVQVRRIKQVDHFKKAKGETFPAYSPRPPTGPKSGMIRHIQNHDHSDSSESASSPRPNTAPGNMQRPVRLQPLPVYYSSGNVPKLSSGSRKKHTSDDDDHRYHSGAERDRYQTSHTADYSMGISPYRLPIINNFVMPVPPPPQTQPKPCTMSRGRRYRPTTAPNGIEVPAKDSAKFHKTSLHSNVKITMVYLGKNVHLSHEDDDYRDEIKVFQQHCGGENLCVYKGRLLEEERFSLVSRRHRGFPFSLTFYINGIQVDRLSSCCEYKHRKGARLGGKNGYFAFVDIEGASPCYRCIIAMGLDKKPSPPPPRNRVRDEIEDNDGQEEEEKVEEGHTCRSDMEDGAQETTNDEEPEDKSDHEEEEPLEEKSAMDYEEEEETERTERADSKTDNYEADDEAKEEYEDDFDTDYKPEDKQTEDRQTGDEEDGKSQPPSDDDDDSEREATSGAASNAMPGAPASDSEEPTQGKPSVADEEKNSAAGKIQTFYRDHRARQRSRHHTHPDKKPSEPSSPRSSDDSSSSDHDTSDEEEIADQKDAEKKEEKPEEPESNEVTEEQEEEAEEEPRAEEPGDVEEGAVDDDHPAVTDSTEADADQSELETTKEDVDINNPEVTDQEIETEATDPKAEVEDSLDMNGEEDGGE